MSPGPEYGEPCGRDDSCRATRCGLPRRPVQRWLPSSSGVFVARAASVRWRSDTPLRDVSNLRARQPAVQVLVCTLRGLLGRSDLCKVGRVSCAVFAASRQCRRGVAFDDRHRAGCCHPPNSCVIRRHRLPWAHAGVAQARRRAGLASRRPTRVPLVGGRRVFVLVAKPRRGAVPHPVLSPPRRSTRSGHGWSRQAGAPRRRQPGQLGPSRRRGRPATQVTPSGWLVIQRPDVPQVGSRSSQQ